MDIAELGFRADSSSVRTATRDLEKLSGTTRKTETATQRLERENAKLERSFFGVRNAVVGFVGAFASIQGIQALSRIADQYANMTTQIRLATNGQEAFARANAEVFAISQRTSTALASTTNLYARITRSTAEYGIEQARILAITETINQTFAVSGTAAANQANAITQLTQAFAGGVLRAEEFNSVIENSPRLAQALADGLGIGIGALRQQVNDGEITVQRMIAALESQAQAVEAEFAQMPITIERGFTQVSNAVLKFIGEADQARGVSESLGSALSAVAQNLPALISALAAAAKIGAVYFATFVALPAAYAAATAALAAYRAMVISTTLATELGIKSALTFGAALRAAASLGIAAFAGWELGKWLRENFLEARLAGVAFVEGTLVGWERIRQGAGIAWEAIKSAAVGVMNTIRTQFADTFSAISKGAGFVGLSGLSNAVAEIEKSLRPSTSAAEDFRAAVARINSETDANIAGIKAITSDMADYEIAQSNAGASTKETAGAIEQLTGSVKGLTDEQKKLAKAEADRIAGLQEQIGLNRRIIELTNDGRTVEEARWVAAYEAADEYNRTLMITEKQIDGLSDAERERADEAKRIADEYVRVAKDQQNEVAKAAEEAARKAQEAYERTAGAIEDVFRGLFRSVFDGFSSFVDQIKRSFENLLVEMAVAAIRNRITVPIATSFTAAGAGGIGGIASLFSGGAGGLGSLFSTLGTNIGSGIFENAVLPLADVLGNAGFESLASSVTSLGATITSNLVPALGGAAGVAALFLGGRALARDDSRINPNLQGIGSVLAPAISLPLTALDKIGGGNVFGTKFRTVAQTLLVDIEEGIFDATLETVQSRKRSLGRGRKWRTITDEMNLFDDELNTAFAQMAQSLKVAHGLFGEVLTPQSFRVSEDFKGKSEEEVQAIIEGILQRAIIGAAVPTALNTAGIGFDTGPIQDALTAELNAAKDRMAAISAEFATLDAERDEIGGFNRLSGRYREVVGQLRALTDEYNGLEAEFASLSQQSVEASQTAAEAVAAAFGGMEPFFSALKFFQANFVDEAELVSRQTNGIITELSALTGTNFTALPSREEFAKLVGSVNAATDPELLRDLLQLGPALNDIIVANEEIASDALDVRRAFGLATSAFDDTLAGLGLAVDDLPNTLGGMQAFIDGLTEADQAALRPFIGDLEALITVTDSASESLRDLSGLTRSLEDEIALLQAADPEMERLNQRFRDLRIEAGDNAGVNVLIETLYGLESAALSASRATAEQAEATRLQEQQQAEATRQIEQYNSQLQSQMESVLAGISRQIDALVQRQEQIRDVRANIFGRSLEEAIGGLSATGDDGEFGRNLQRIGDINQEQFATQVDFARAQAKAANSLDTLNVQIDDEIDLLNQAIANTSRSFGQLMQQNARGTSTVVDAIRQSGEFVAQAVAGAVSAAAINSAAAASGGGGGGSFSIPYGDPSGQYVNGIPLNSDPLYNRPEILAAQERARNSAVNFELRPQDALSFIAFEQRLGEYGYSGQTSAADLFRQSQNTSGGIDIPGLSSALSGGVQSFASYYGGNGVGSLIDPSSDLYDPFAVNQLLDGVPGFADGGMHSGGMRLVGERGWELEATGPARIWNQQQLGAALRGGDDGTRAEVAEMRAELKQANELIVALLRANEKNTSRTETVLRKVTGNGGAVRVVEEAAP